MDASHSGNNLKRYYGVNAMIDVYEVVTKLIGAVNPIGETRTDDARYENLKTMCALVNQLLSDIDAVIPYKDRVEFSMKRAGEYARKSMTDEFGIEE